MLPQQITDAHILGSFFTKSEHTPTVVCHFYLVKIHDKIQLFEHTLNLFKLFSMYVK